MAGGTSFLKVAWDDAAIHQHRETRCPMANQSAYRNNGQTLASESSDGSHSNRHTKPSPVLVLITWPAVSTPAYPQQARKVVFPLENHAAPLKNHPAKIQRAVWLQCRPTVSSQTNSSLLPERESESLLRMSGNQNADGNRRKHDDCVIPVHHAWPPFTALPMA